MSLKIASPRRPVPVGLNRAPVNSIIKSVNLAFAAPVSPARIPMQNRNFWSTTRAAGGVVLDSANSVGSPRCARAASSRSPGERRQ